MVRIRQHGDNGELYDLNEFLKDLAVLSPMDEWHVSVDECLGDGAAEVEALGTSGTKSIPNDTLCTLYRNIYQTIDGEFIGFRSGIEIFRFLAVDSSYWEITGSPDVEATFVRRYGLYAR